MLFLLRRFALALTIACLGASAAALPAAADQVQLTAILAGANEIPGPGDPQGSGTAVFTVNTDHAQICYQLTVSLGATVTAAHIHKGDAATAGPVVVTLDTPVNGVSNNCVSVDSQLAADIAANPRAYYANVHTTDFPGGAARGQLDFAGSQHGSDSVPNHSANQTDHGANSGHGDQSGGHDDRSESNEH